jgi:DNA invertase Pin-like site-specific DNA recombinase
VTPGIAAYVRVSTNEQTTSMQRETIERWLADGLVATSEHVIQVPIAFC